MMSENDREELIVEAVKNHFFRFAYLEPDEVKIKLGKPFEDAVSKFQALVLKHRRLFEAEFREMDDERLSYHASKDSCDRDAHIDPVIYDLDKNARSEIGALNRYFLIAIGWFPEYLPDYDMWGLRDTFEPDELKWLSMGFEPTHDLITGKAANRPFGNEERDPLMDKEADIRHEIIRRSGTLGSYGHRDIKAFDALEWLGSIDLSVPVGFRRMLREAASRTSPKDSPSGAIPETTTDKADPRAIRSVSKIIAAMAIDGYGWQPNSKKSPIPGEIESLCDRMGIGVSRETILYYLRLGAKQLPNDE